MPKDTFFNLPVEKQEKVMRSTISEFIEHGFEKGNIGDIAKNAGVAKGSMYQYFENKRELFLFSVRWSIELIVKKYDKYITMTDKDTDIFNFFYQNAKDMWCQMRDEREVVIFIQDVFLGKYNSMTDESMAYMIKASDEYLLNLIKNGKKNGSIRKDIDDNMLSLFITGVSFKIKEYMMNKARSLGEDIIDESFEVNEKEIKAMIELLKNGMGTKVNNLCGQNKEC
jgi:AcrR family transcriptional regulator